MTLRQKYHKNRKVTIYETVCLTTGQRYIGSTTDYTTRKSRHKKNNNDCESKNIIKNNNYKFNILEEFNCNFELSKLLKEQYYLDNLENINKNRALQLSNTKKKYDRDYMKIWRKNRTQEEKEKYKKVRNINDRKNKIKINQQHQKWASVKYTCDCGKSIRRDSKVKHNKSKYHLHYLRNNFYLKIVIV